MTSIVWNVLYWGWSASEVALVAMTRTRTSSGTVRDRGSLYVLWVVVFSSIFMGTWYGLSHAHTMFGGAAWVRTASVAAMMIGLAIRWASILSLGRSFSVNVAIHADQTLYRKGLFALVRHPSYTGLMLIFAALGMRTQNWVGMAILVVPPFLALLRRMQVEERALTEAFGGQYRAYQHETKRLVPGVY